ncbi:hypothetical protein [Planobispora rosea]|uniref:flagellin N-terminal helical domain-containing protein n=1 Tax=Planobispora rosea TaxID=35762 RepID=UPI00083AC08B|nr:hypothetical protein [Planobispora rosea]
MGLRIDQSTGVANAHRRPPAESNPAVPAGTPSGDLHTGRPVNESAEPPSGEHTRAQADQLRTVVRSAQDGISAIQAVDAALAQASSVLHHMRGLAVQAASGSSPRPTPRCRPRPTRRRGPR